MNIDFEQLTASERYFHTIQTLIPRPIAWVLSQHENGSFNLAPFSYFSAICSDPALLMISVGRKSKAEQKDTRANIEARKQFVVHIASMANIHAMNESAASLPANVSEVEQLGLATEAFDGFALPRLSCAKAAFACELNAIHEVGHARQAVIYGEIKRLYLADEIIDTDNNGRIKVDAGKLDPIARLGANEYAGLSEIIRMQRPA